MTERVEQRSAELLTLRRMASRLGVPSRWLKEHAERGDVPGLKAGARWLFVAEPTTRAVVALAEQVGVSRSEVANG